MIAMMKIASGEDAWRYFQDSVAPEAVLTRAVDYYTAEGTPPGRWLGSGLVGLGLVEGRTVSPSELSHLYGEGAHPLTGDQLSRKFIVPPTLDERVAARVKALSLTASVEERDDAVARIVAEEAARTPRTSVAGFELVFNPAKSVSVLWALAPEGVRERIRAGHEQALRDTVAILERDALRTRQGTDGAAQVEVKGAVATAFERWDTRDSDPHPHTHLLVANRVQAEDGQWRTIDSRHALSPNVVTLSEFYDAALMNELSLRLGVEWTERTVEKDRDGYERFLIEREVTDSQQSRAMFADVAGVLPRNRKWEIRGIDVGLLEEFSSRASAIGTAKEKLIEEFRAATGREPTRFQVWRMRAAATRTTRKPKVVRALAELRATWRERATGFNADTTAAVDTVIATGAARLATAASWTVAHADVASAEVIGSDARA